MQMMRIEQENYNRFYEQISAPFRKGEKGIRLINLVNEILTKTVYLIYPLWIIYLFFMKYSKMMQVVFVPAAAFLLLSLVRKKIRRQRPYERWSIKPLIQKETKGKSMPSRHVFSSSVIAMAFLSVSPVMGIIFLIWSLLLAVVRVIGGVHYPSDVLAGFLLGAAAGLFCFV